MSKATFVFLAFMACFIVAVAAAMKYRGQKTTDTNVAPTGAGENGNAYLTYNLMGGVNAAPVQAGIPTGENFLAGRSELAEAYTPYLSVLLASTADVTAYTNRTVH